MSSIPLPSSPAIFLRSVKIDCPSGHVVNQSNDAVMSKE
ncbi:MAG: hypothetical protein OJF52_000386 [Nitrospira sp.]|nr:MAG: hypothetical protein OJF52_000386 [Nitrospira sp.]